MEQIKKKKIIITAAMIILVVLFEVFIFLSKPQRLRLNGGLGALAKQTPAPGFFKNIKIKKGASNG